MLNAIYRQWLVQNLWMAGLAVLLSGCAAVYVEPLNPDGTSAKAQSPGVRYYLPKPYLLVTLIPADQQTTSPPSPGSPREIPPNPPGSGPSGGLHSEQGHPAPGGAPAGSGSNQPNNGTPSSTSSAATPSQPSNTGFLAQSKQYVVKLIYLPDFRHPMAMTESPGLMGAVSMGAVLQDGWLLTSLQASGDSKVSDTLNAIASLVSSAMGGGAGGGAVSKAKPPAPGGAPSGERAASPVSAEMLAPGLYEFHYNEQTGVMTGLCAMTLFQAGGNIPGDCPGQAQALPGSGTNLPK